MKKLEGYEGKAPSISNKNIVVPFALWSDEKGRFFVELLKKGRKSKVPKGLISVAENAQLAYSEKPAKSFKICTYDSHGNSEGISKAAYVPGSTMAVMRHLLRTSPSNA